MEVEHAEMLINFKSCSDIAAEKNVSIIITTLPLISRVQTALTAGDMCVFLPSSASPRLELIDEYQSRRYIAAGSSGIRLQLRLREYKKYFNNLGNKQGWTTVHA
jgi:hypothetical protein